MGMINSQDVKNGMCIKLDGRLYFVIEFLHVKPGKGNTIMRTKLKDVVNGRVLDRTFQVGFKLEEVRVERRPYQYLYQEGDDYIFMNQENYEQIPIAKEIITGVDFLKEGNLVDVVSDATAEAILYAELPVKVVLAITYTEPGLKGDTATNATKPATLETGGTIRVPLFINEGELVEVDTRDGSYVGRVKP
jgi:elongation factor P